MAEQDAPGAPAWSQAPEEWSWRAQDADGKWYWYRSKPVMGLAGGVWRCNSRHQQFAQTGPANPDWLETLAQRPEHGFDGRATTAGTLPADSPVAETRGEGAWPDRG